ncbi:MAG TPA: MBL fold metallo-hydrolase [Vicinamibacterales bacterium]|jgi:glyoxylase-like metal-dependent hydrolase (beta-lactamase superfamily II)|nr:MBL fold metallo-hydrolase [Vicinamibacterales bacterium]
MKTTTGTLILVVLAAGLLGPAKTGHYELRADAGRYDAVAAQGPRGPARDITNVAGDLYRVRNGAWATVFYVTPDGIILGDPINVALSTWLKDQLAQRFKVPVRYVVYSHSHFDHAEGGAVFADTAKFVAHENMLRNMDGRYPQMPGDMLDRNDNGVIDPDEIDIPTKTRPGVCGWGPSFFTTWDHNKDGKVTPGELQRDIRRPDIVYSQRMRLELGGHVVELIHPGLNHSDDATVMYFPAERAVFATEFLADALVTTNIKSLPSACGPFDGSPLSEWLKSYRTVESLDFDILAAGHGTGLFKKADVAMTREFFEDLIAAVSAGMKQGKSLEDMEKTILLEKYKDWAQYDRLRVYNIRSAYQNLKTYR